MNDGCLPTTSQTSTSDPTRTTNHGPAIHEQNIPLSDVSFVKGPFNDSVGEVADDERSNDGEHLEQTHAVPSELAETKQSSVVALADGTDILFDESDADEQGGASTGMELEVSEGGEDGTRKSLSFLRFANQRKLSKRRSYPREADYRRVNSDLPLYFRLPAIGGADGAGNSAVKTDVTVKKKERAADGWKDGGPKPDPSKKQSNMWRIAMYYLRLAELGDTDAKCDLGTCYERGKGVERDIERAISLYRSAAHDGHMRAQFHLARCHANGLGTLPVDWARAVTLYKRAARQGHVPSICNLGVCYHNGRGVERDTTRAVTLYRDAAVQDYARAWYNLGVCYESGTGVARDMARAAALYRKAMHGKFAQATCSLGACYEHGLGVHRDENKAVELYRKAAKGGCARALFYLGLCYESGIGVTGSLNDAVSLYEKAADLGLQDAVVYLHRFQARMHQFQSSAAKAENEIVILQREGSVEI